MGFYACHILPWLMEKVLSRPEFHDQRLAALGRAWGRTLEIGFGFGATLGAYPREGVAHLVALESNPGMTRRASRRAGGAPFPVLLVRASAAVLPFPDRTFDTIVSNWTLCTVAPLRGALLEIRRVLRPGGLFLFLEHGLAQDPRLARRQRWLTPVQRLVANGCRLDIRIDEEIGAAGLRIEALERYEGGLGPRSLRQMYRGVARAA
ncbi:MAG: class I SAM-dependent methyltransferase [Acidobacteria bacterium]|nr:class I SAM-dependent methyltransferase [Acidobacteriota bacterium]